MSHLRRCPFTAAHSRYCLSQIPYARLTATFLINSLFPRLDLSSILFARNLLEWLQQHHNNPVTGEPLDLKDIIPLIFHKNAEGQFHCPVTYKIFTPHTHIVAVRTSGHVYSYEAIRQLNIEPQHWKCLLSGIDFTREDIIHLQDPHNLEHRNAQLFECHRKAPEPSSAAIAQLCARRKRIYVIARVAACHRLPWRLLVCGVVARGGLQGAMP